MNPILRNILALIAGIVVGSVVNMGIVYLSLAVNPLPEGVDINDTEAFRKAVADFVPADFILPFLAHALGTLAGAVLTFILAISHKAKWALGVGVFFLIGGILNVYNIDPPLWFILVDLIAAYLPMGWLGGQIGARFGSNS